MKTVIKLKRKHAEKFKNQLTYGAPPNEDEVGLRRLSEQIKSKKVIAKLYLRENLHAKLYMLFRPDAIYRVLIRDVGNSLSAWVFNFHFTYIM